MARNWQGGIDGAALLVEFGLDSLPSVVPSSTTWTDVTADVRAWRVRRGRSDEFGDYQPGTCTVVLDNRDRLYDPSHAGGAYFGKLLPMKRVRLSVVYAATTTVLYSGYVLGWPQAYDRNARDATVTVNAADAFFVLQRTVLASLYEYEARQDSPVLWFRLGDRGSLVDTGASLITGAIGSIGGGVTSGLALGSANALEFAQGEIGVTAGDTRVISHVAWPAFPFTIEFWLNAPAPADPLNTMRPITVNGPIGVSVGQIIFECAATTLSVTYADASLSFSLSASATWDPTKTTHVVAAFTSSSAVNLYLNYNEGTGSGGPTGSPPNVGTASIVLSYNASGAGLPATLLPFAGVLDEFAVYATGLSGARVLAHWTAGAFGAPEAVRGMGAGGLSGVQVTKVLDIAAFPGGERVIGTGLSTVVLGNTATRTALDALKDIERTEQGRFYIDETGRAVFRDRHYTLGLTSTLTFGDAGAELRYSDIGYDYSQTYVRNDITVTGITGNGYTVSDATSVAAYLRCGDSVSGLLHTTDTQNRDIAYWRLANFKDPVLRITRLELKPRRSPTTLFPAIQALSLAQMVTVLHRPQGVGSAISQDVIVEGIEHEVGYDGEWTTTLYLSPAETSTGGSGTSGFAAVGTGVVGASRIA